MAKLIRFDFDPFEIAGVAKPKGRLRDEILTEVADYVKTSVLSYIGEEASPVSGPGKWKRLSKDYAEHKSDEAGNTMANLELTGDMLDALTVDTIRGGKLRLWVNDSDQSGKVEGHNTGFAGHPTIKNGPKRQFIPNNDQTFKRDILNGIRRTVRDLLGDD